MNTTYDAQSESTYEDMGIAVAWLSPDNAHGATAPNVNPFAAPTDAAEGCPSGGLPAGYLCDKGWVTHGHMAEAANHGGPNGTISTNRLGAQTTQVAIGAFQFSPGDQSTIQSTGIPTVPIGGSLTFNNLDAWGDVYHSITSCAYPCTGPTGIAFPLGDGRSSLGDAKDFDSGQLGYEPEVFVGQHFGPAKDTTSWTLPVTSQNGFKPGAIYTYYCRVHPFMRGVFAVTASGNGPSANTDLALPASAGSRATGPVVAGRSDGVPLPLPSAPAILPTGPRLVPAPLLRPLPLD